VQGHAESYCLGENLRHRRPSHRDQGFYQSTAHKGDGFAQQKNLDFMTSFRQCVGMKKSKGSLRWVVRPPGTLDQNLAHASTAYEASLEWWWGNPPCEA
jgi:hypothetical protein